MSRKIVLPDGYYRDRLNIGSERFIVEIRQASGREVAIRCHWDSGVVSSWVDSRVELPAYRYRAISKEEALVFLAKARLTR